MNLQKRLCQECRRELEADPAIIRELFCSGAKPLWNYNRMPMFIISGLSIEVFQLFLDNGMTYLSEDPDDPPLLHHIVSAIV